MIGKCSSLFKASLLADHFPELITRLSVRPILLSNFFRRIVALGVFATWLSVRVLLLGSGFLGLVITRSYIIRLYLRRS